MFECAHFCLDEHMKSILEIEFIVYDLDLDLSLGTQ